MKTVQMARVEMKAERRPVVHYRGWRDVRWIRDSDATCTWP